MASASVPRSPSSRSASPSAATSCSRPTSFIGFQSRRSFHSSPISVATARASDSASSRVRHPGRNGDATARRMSISWRRSRSSPADEGVVGFCFAGKFALLVAAARPDRVAAAASFHGGGLFTDTVDSPTLVLPRVKARLYFRPRHQRPGLNAEAIEKFSGRRCARGAASIRRDVTMPGTAG